MDKRYPVPIDDRTGQGRYVQLASEKGTSNRLEGSTELKEIDLTRETSR